MGTRGLVFVRCCGRYYIYYNNLDSYPEGLGVAIVAEIPLDPEKYGEWLDAMRATYTRLSRQFEENILCISSNSDQPEGMDLPSGRYAKSYLAVDDRLEMPPLQTVLPDVERWDIEWTYTLDLDRELLAIDNSIFFRLSRIPHEANWIEYLAEDRYGRRALRQNTPQNLIGDSAREVEVNQAMKKRYRDFEVELNIPEVIPSLGVELLTREKFLWNIFMAVHDKYRLLLDGFLLGWAPQSFAFREVAFAILSLAAGEVTFECPQDFNRNYQREGFFLIPPSRYHNSQHNLLPRFLHECHLPGVEPGSAPQGTTFWLGNVLIYLTTRADLVDVEEAAIAEVVEAGLDQGQGLFRAMVFSIMDFILIYAQKKEDGNVRILRSHLMNLFYFDDRNSRFSKGPRTRNQKGSLANVTNPLNLTMGESRGYIGPLSDKSNPTTAFLMVMRFFDAATNQRLMGTSSSVFPNEILSSVMEASDCQTYQSLAKVSACCRDIYYRKFRLNDNYAVVGVDAEAGVNHFVLEDLRSGNKFVSDLRRNCTPSWSRNKDNGIEINPVIGVADPTRRSIIDGVSLVFSNMTSRHPPYKRREDMPVQDFFRYIQEAGGPKPEQLFTLPDYFYPGSVEDAWGRYILGLIQDNSKDSSNYRFVLINGAAFRCLLPHGYRELTMDHFFCNGLHAFIRHARDETPEEWAETIRYAVQQLHRKETSKRQRFDFHVQGRPVIVAFTRKVKFFYYVYRCAETPPVPENARPHCLEIAERSTNADPGCRLVQLIPGNEPLNLDDKHSREVFESWIQIFCKNEEMMTEYDPFTEKQVPLMSERTLKGIDFQN